MASRIVVMKDGFIQQIGEPNEIYRNPANMFVAGFIGTPAMNFLHGTVSNGYFIIDSTQEKIMLTPEQKELLKNYEGKRVVYGIRPENLEYEKSERFEKFKDCSFRMKANMIELLGDIINVHGGVGDGKVILKMSSKYSVKEKDEFKAAIDSEHSKFFNETTGKAITPDYCEYEEVETIASLDEDNVVIVEQKSQGIISKAVGAVKAKIKSAKSKKEETQLKENLPQIENNENSESPETDKNTENE